MTDRETNLALSGVTVKVGATGGTTDKNGNFSISATIKTLTEKGITFSCIGYLSTHLIFEPNHFYDVALVATSTQLKEVVIGAGDDIIKKAVQKIPDNYPDKPFILNGILRTQTWRNKSEYFRSDAVIKAYVPPYNGHEKTTVTVLQTNLDTINDKALRHLRHYSSYNAVEFEDIAHDRYLLTKILKKRKFDYWLTGKQNYNNHKVFVINTTVKDSSKTYDRIEATLYIDTASYAFVAANIYTYNLARAGFLTNKVLNYRVAYSQAGNKWYLNETHITDTSVYKNQLPITTVDFIRTSVDSVNVQPIPYKDIIQRQDDIL